MRNGFRALFKSKLASLVSIVGLGIGISAALLIGIYIDDELSYDRWLPEYEKIFRLQVSSVNSDTTFRYIQIPSDTGLWLRQDYPQIESVTRVDPSIEIVGKDNEAYSETIFWVDSNFFEIFQFPTISGLLETALEQPNSLVINESIAEKYFGSTDPLGQVLAVNIEHPMVVRAVISDIPSNTHIRPGIIASGNSRPSPLLEQDRIPIVESFGRKSWSVRTYLKLPDEISPSSIESDLPTMLDRRLPRETGRKNSEVYGLELVPIADIHLNGPDSSQRSVDLRNVYSVAAIALLIVVAAAINFVNLHSARNLRKNHEIAIRKTLGAGRKELTWQFINESFAVVLVAAVLAVLVVALILPVFNNYLSRTIGLSGLFSPVVISAFLLTVLAASVLSGLYQSSLLAHTSPAQDFHRNSPKKGGGARNLLSVVQFAILTGLLIGTMTIFLQVRFAVGEALRQDTDPVLVSPTFCENPLRLALVDIPDVIDVSCTEDLPQQGIGSSTGIAVKADNSRGISVWYTSIDTKFFELYEIDLVAGRNFSDDRPRDRSPENNQWLVPEPIIITESTSRLLGFDSAQDSIGQILSWDRLYRLPSTFTGVHDAEVVGVVEDFQIGTVRSVRQNAAFMYDPGLWFQASIKISGENVPEVLEEIDRIWRNFNGGGPAQIVFFDEMIESMYRSVIRQRDLLSVYASVAVFIAILGLVGLAAYVVQERTKEIGIRKVVGASRTEIITLLLWRFSKPVLLSNLLAWPVAYYYLNQWLAGFARHIDLQWWIFLAASSVTLSIALLTVFSHAYLASGTNPVNALRYE